VEVAAGPQGRAGQGWPAWLVRRAGRVVSWLTLAFTLLTFVIVVLRYGFNQGWIWMQESVTYLHAVVFMVAAAWAFQTDDHVRVDIFYRDRSERYRTWVNLVGTLVLLVPFSVFTLWVSWDYVAASWATREGSMEAGGLPLVWALKTVILVMPALLLLQAWSTASACLAALRR
jgi:TRAP-type mannitol/chloroaromatic compound transport system permease small subunit